MAEAHSGRRFTDEHKQKMSDAHSGKPHPHPKYKWQDSAGNIHIMDANNAKRHHPEWKKIEEE